MKKEISGTLRSHFKAEISGLEVRISHSSLSNLFGLFEKTKIVIIPSGDEIKLDSALKAFCDAYYRTIAETQDKNDFSGEGEKYFAERGAGLAKRIQESYNSKR